MELGRLTQLDVREAWSNEAGDFTPWLAQEDNLALLGDAIGLELELEAQEKDVGPFRADILCTEVGSDQWVLIENQLARTDHTHLGQLLTYAAGLKAASIIWIASHFTDEHRAALDWLNEITEEPFNFFGLEVQLWTIDGHSRPAPHFRIVCKPNAWTHALGSAAKRAAEEQLSDTQQLYLDYWQEFKDHVANNNGSISINKPQPQSWTNVPIGRSGFTLAAIISRRNRTARVRLTIQAPQRIPSFRLLQQQRGQIEAQLGELEWNEWPGKKESHVDLLFENWDIEDRQDWPRQHREMLESVKQFKACFQERVKKLDAADYEPDMEEEET